MEEVKLPVKRGSLSTTQDEDEEDDSMDVEGQSHSRTQDTSTNSGSRQEVRGTDSGLREQPLLLTSLLALRFPPSSPPRPHVL